MIGSNRLRIKEIINIKSFFYFYLLNMDISYYLHYQPEILYEYS